MRNIFPPRGAPSHPSAAERFAPQGAPPQAGDDLAQLPYLFLTVLGDSLTMTRSSSMKKRHKIPLHSSKKHFTRHALHVHPKNFLHSSLPMRGGIRL